MMSLLDEVLLQLTVLDRAPRYDGWGVALSVVGLGVTVKMCKSQISTQKYGRTHVFECCSRHNLVLIGLHVLRTALCVLVWPSPVCSHRAHCAPLLTMAIYLLRDRCSTSFAVFVFRLCRRVGPRCIIDAAHRDGRRLASSLARPAIAYGLSKHAHP